MTADPTGRKSWEEFLWPPGRRQRQYGSILSWCFRRGGGRQIMSSSGTNSLECIMHCLYKQKCCVIRPQERGSQRYENSHKLWSFFFFPSKFKKSGVLGELELNQCKTKERKSSTIAEATRHFLSHRFLREKRFSQQTNSSQPQQSLRRCKAEWVGGSRRCSSGEEGAAERDSGAIWWPRQGCYPHSHIQGWPALKQFIEKKAFNMV